MDLRKTTIYNELEVIRDLKVNELNSWLNYRIGDIRTIADDDEIRQLGENMGNSMLNKKDEAVFTDAKNHIDRIVRNHRAFSEIFVVDSSTGRILVSSDKTAEGRYCTKESYFTGAIDNKGLFIKDIYYSNTENRPSMTFSMPVFSMNKRGQIVGVLVARINLESSLYKLLLNREGMGETGETLIVNKDEIALNELRWYSGAPLKLKIMREDTIYAVQGETGVMETEDYRGEKVLAAYTQVPRTGWGFIAKQDIRESYAPIYELKKWTLLVAVITVLGVVILAVAVSASISRSIEALDKGTEIIGSGNLDYKVGTDRQDEIGKLSRKFDLMIEKIKMVTASRDELNYEIAERRRLAKAVFEVEERERQRIGYDLHDGLGQLLTGISFKSQYLFDSLKERSVPEAEDAERIIFLIDRAKEKVKLLSKGLSPIVGKGEESLMLAMKDLAARVEKMFDVHCRLICDAPVLINNESAVANLYRIAQEAVTNAVKHGKSKNIEVCLEREDDEIILTIKDDGNGIHEFNTGNSGMGLGIMKYRANIINASFDIRPLESGGTLVKCVLNDKKGKGEIL